MGREIDALLVTWTAILNTIRDRDMHRKNARCIYYEILTRSRLALKVIHTLDNITSWKVVSICMGPADYGQWNVSNDVDSLYPSSTDL